MDLVTAIRSEHVWLEENLAELEGTARSPDVAEFKRRAGIFCADLLGHAQLEDELLFGPLEPSLGTGAGPLSAMRADHDRIENGLAQLRQAPDIAQAKAVLAETAEVVRDHFQREEMLFAMAGELLDQDRLGQLGSQWIEKRPPR